MCYRTCGGGGYGDPMERDPELVARDVREMRISQQRAERAYGVVIDPRTFAVDRHATETLRRAKCAV